MIRSARESDGPGSLRGVPFHGRGHRYQVGRAGGTGRSAAGHHFDKNRLFLRLFLQNQRRLYAYILTLLPNRADADDVLQETSLVMWDKFDADGPPDRLPRLGPAHRVPQGARLLQEVAAAPRPGSAASSSSGSAETRRRAGRGPAARRPPRGAGRVRREARPARPRPAHPPLRRRRHHAVHLRASSAARSMPSTRRSRSSAKPCSTASRSPSPGRADTVTPESPIIAELQPLLDALCEETITPEQLRRLEELVLNHPEAEAHYVRFMSFYADLIGHVAGLPEPPRPHRGRPDCPPCAEPRPIATRRLTQPHATTTKRRTRCNAPAFAGRSPRRAGRPRRSATLGGVPVLRLVQPVARRRRDTQRVARRRPRRTRAGSRPSRRPRSEAARRTIDAATAAEQQIAKRLTRPRWKPPGRRSRRRTSSSGSPARRTSSPAPRTSGRSRRSATARSRGRRRWTSSSRTRRTRNSSARRTTSRSASRRSNCPTAFWEKVKPGTDLFLEVVAYTDDDRKSVLAERLPARAAGVRHAPRHRQAAVQAGRNDPLPLADARPLHAPAAGDTTCT